MQAAILSARCCVLRAYMDGQASQIPDNNVRHCMLHVACCVLHGDEDSVGCRMFLVAWRLLPVALPYSYHARWFVLLAQCDRWHYL
jgi:hypothetical protein